MAATRSCTTACSARRRSTSSGTPSAPCSSRTKPARQRHLSQNGPMDADAGRALLTSLIEEVTASDARRYGVTDDIGRTMDCAKIVEDVEGLHNPRRYLAVYHSMLADGRF